MTRRATRRFVSTYRSLRAETPDLIDEYASRIGDVFRDQGRVATRRLRTLRRSLDTRPAITAATAPHLRTDEVLLGGFGDELRARVGPEIEADHQRVGVALAGAAFAASALARRRARAQAARLDDVGADAAAALDLTLADAYVEGDDFDAMTEKVGGAFDRLATTVASAAAVVATTGLVASASTTAAQVSLLDVRRTWRTVGDERVRDAHDLMEGTEVALDEPFDFGFATLQFPGDPDGPDELVIGCRCWLDFSEPPDEVPLTGNEE